uniref:tumor necrosis factor receptor superfamily member 3-like n=1 Tax=Pristiophorus japonicus TaxID=55135 RepID=UPI00398EA7B4
MNVPGVRALLVAVLCRSALTTSEPYAPQRGSCRAVTDYLEPNIGICCRKCEPGYYAERRCNLSMDTSCMPCPPGEYTEFWNYVRECKLCQSCDQRRELVVGVNCTTMARTVCECRSGYHCIEDTDCTECERHSPCSPGQELVQPGNTMEDTQCRVCPPGTFQKQVSLGKCRRHKNCTARRLIEVRAGSPKSDAVCEKVALKPSRIPPLLLVGSTTSIGSTTKSVDPPSSNSYLLIIVIAMTILCLCVIVAGFALYVRSRIRKKGQKRNTDTKAVEDVDGTSLESKQPLIDEKQPSPPTHRPMCASVPGGAGPREAQGRLDTDCLSQTCPGDRGGSGAPCQIPANGPGLDPEPRGRAHCQDPPRPYPQPRPEGPTRPGGQADIFAAHGVLGLQ